MEGYHKLEFFLICACFYFNDKSLSNLGLNLPKQAGAELKCSAWNVLADYNFCKPQIQYKIRILFFDFRHQNLRRTCVQFFVCF